MDYHVEFDKKFYSLPYKLYSKTVEILATQNTIEIYHKGQRVAIHRRSNAARNPEEIVLRASKVGPQAEKWARGVFDFGPDLSGFSGGLPPT